MADKLAQYDLLSSIMIVWHPVYDVSIETLSSMDLNEKPGFFFRLTPGWRNPCEVRPSLEMFVVQVV
jgi:hypothetical protein